MRKIFYLFLLGLMGPAGKLSAQEILPGITVKNYNGKIIVSWRNQYPIEVKTINIQRSFDSGRNFKTIGSVLNPQNTENGFVDEAPPYNKMYYRLFITFDAGNYIFSEPVRPVKEIPQPSPMITQDVTVVPLVPAELKTTVKEPDKKITVPAEKTRTRSVAKKGKGKKGKELVARNSKKGKKVPVQKDEPPVPAPVEETAVTYPSKRIFASKDNNVVINLPNFESRKYVVKFFDEEEKPLFELNRIKEDYLIVEKVNFQHAGWFYFEIYENGRMIEKNKFFIPRDGRISN